LTHSVVYVTANAVCDYLYMSTLWYAAIWLAL